MSSCCLSGFIASGSPSGMEKEIAGTMTYVAEPESGSTKQTVIFLPDSNVPLNPPCRLNTNNPSPNSLRLATPQHPPARRRIREGRLHSLHTRRPRRRLAGRIPPGLRRASLT